LEALVRRLLELGFAGVTLCALGSITATAAPAAIAAPTGVIMQADRAYIGQAEAANGATILDGDVVHTIGGGLLRLRFGSSQAYLTPDSSARIHQLPHGFGADLLRGTVVLSASNGETFQLLADGASIRPGTGQPTVAQVTMVSPSELLLTSRKGTLEVAVESEIKTIPEDTAYRMIIEPDPSSPAAPQNPRPGGRNRVIWILWLSVAAGAAVAVALALMSPSKP
jgi:hypothetical protein